MTNKINLNPEEIIADEVLQKAKDTYKYNGPNVNLTDEQKAKFIPYTVETVEDVIMIMAYAIKEENSDLLVEIHDRLMVSDLTFAYDILIVMIQLGDDKGMYFNFVPYTTKSKIDSKGIYRRCLGAIGFYKSKHRTSMGNGYNNPVLGLEYQQNFGNGLGGIEINENTDLKKDGYDIGEQYREYISEKYKELIQKVLAV